MDSAPTIDISLTIGAYQIGVLVSYLLAGVMITQTYMYYSHFPEDSLRLKVLVGFVCCSEMAHAVCIGHTLYVYTISNYGHLDSLVPPHSLEAAILFSGLVAVSVQSFFSFRIYALKKPYIAVLCWILSALRLLGDISVSITAVGMTSLERYEKQWGWLFMAVWCISTATDVTIAATLVAILYNQRSNVRQGTVALVDRIIAWTLETGLLTSASGIIMLICFVKMEGNLIWLSFFNVGARLFSNSLLASLNSRAVLRAMNEVPSVYLTAAIALPTVDGVSPSKGADAAQNPGPHHDDGEA